MKLHPTHLVIDLIKKNPIHYSYFDKLVLTQKSVNESTKIKIKLEDDTDLITLDSYKKGMDLLVKILPRRKFLLIDPTTEGMVCEYSTNGYMMEINIHLYKFDKLINYKFIYVRESNIVISEVVTELTFDEKLKLELLSNSYNYSSFSTWMNVLVTTMFLPQIVFIELSKEKIKFNVIQPNIKFGNVMKGNNLKNETNLKLTLVDSLWTIKSIGIGIFEVSGHFRLQPYGKGLCDIKLIYIETYIKTHYIRKSTRELTFG